MSKEYYLDMMYKVFICIGTPTIIYFLSAIYFQIEKQNKWLMDEEEIDNIGKN